MDEYIPLSSSPPPDFLQQHFVKCSKCGHSMTLKYKGKKYPRKVIDLLIQMAHVKDCHYKFYMFLPQFNLTVDTVIEGNKLCTFK